MKIATCWMLSGLLSGAVAQEWESEPRLFRFEETKPVRADALEIPLLVDVISGVVDGVGVVPRLTGNAEIGMYMEGESNLSWPVVGQDSSVYHAITPLESSSFLGMSSSMQLTVSVQARIAGNPFSFQVVSEEALFKDEVARFTPFLLPFQPGDAGMILQPEAVSGTFRFPVTIPVISEGVFSLGVGVEVFADPISSGEIYGVSLDTIVTQQDGFVDTFSTDGSDLTADNDFRNEVQLFEQADELEIASQWVTEIGTRLGYLIGVDFTIEIQAFGFTVPFKFTLWQEQFDIFPYLEEQQTYDAHPETSPYYHPLPMVGLGREEVSFVDIPVGEERASSIAILNEGRLDLEGVVSLVDDGSGAFSVAPADLAVAAGDRQSLTVTFNPERRGSYVAELVLETNDPVQPEVRVPIRAESVNAGSDGDLQGSDQGGLYGQGDGALFQTCGCASSSLTPSGLAPWALFSLLVMGRRQRRG